MKALGLNEIREKYLSFFESKGHLRMKSASLVPQNDKSLLLINSGMAPLKPFFTGKEIPPRKRVTTCQKCIRTCDIENVGKTARHGTYFEMLGNFSFGDYFKKEIIPWAWEFVTKVLEIPEDRLYITVYEDDDEAADIWVEKVGVPRNRIVKLGKEDNFWEHGVGPCGPCSEIYFDRGEEFGCGKEGCSVGCDCDRYMEFWNLVFTQFDKQEDGSYPRLANPNIDTGMGLERMAAIMQGVTSIFDVDTIKAIRDEVCRLANVTYMTDAQKDVSIRLITDHIRSVSFMTADGVLPSNEGRGYVLRRLLRRAARHGKKLGISGLFLAELSKKVIEVSEDAYPELREKSEHIFKTLANEEKRFYETIDQGTDILKTYIKELKDSGQKVLSGAHSFKLYDTYGFPVDLTQEMLEEEGLELDEEAFHKEMEIQRNRARSSRAVDTYMGAEDTVFNKLDPSMTSTFMGYTELELNDCKILAITKNNEIIDKAYADDEIAVILDKTPFYAEMGGQAGDEGIIKTSDGSMEVNNTIKAGSNKIVHIGTVIEGVVSTGDIVEALVNKEKRMAISRNHSATHLLQKALRTILGNHVEQAGSSVNVERLRFDFSHTEPMTTEELNQVETLVNKSILDDLPIVTKETSIEAAKKEGAMALFGEKYGDVVRLVNMGGYSIELCGGTHLSNTAQAGTFKIISETGVSAGVRRIEALTGENAIAYYRTQELQIKELASMIKSTPNNLNKKLESILNELKTAKNEIEQFKSKMAGGKIDSILSNLNEINGVKVVTARVDDMDGNELRTLGDQLKNKIGSGVIVMTSGKDSKVNILVMATDDIVKKGIHAGNIVKESSAVANGKGGGRPNMAQAGSCDIEKLASVMDKAVEIIKQQLV